MKTKILPAIALLAMGAFALVASCNKDDQLSDNATVRSISFDNLAGQDTFFIPFNRQHTLTCKVEMSLANAAIPTLMWTSSNPEIQVGDRTGASCRLLGTVDGAASTITVSAEDGSKSASILVVVNTNRADFETVPLTGIRIRVIQNPEQEITNAPQAVTATPYTITGGTANSCSALSAEVTGSYVYLEVMFEPASTTFALPDTARAPIGNSDAVGAIWYRPEGQTAFTYFNTNASFNATGRTNGKIVRVLPREVGGPEAITAKVGGFTQVINITTVTPSNATVSDLAFASPTAATPLNATKNLTCNVTMLPPTAPIPTDLAWTSSDTNKVAIRGVDKNVCTLYGKIADATATITVATADGSKSASCEVTVTGDVVTPLEGIYFRIRNASNASDYVSTATYVSDNDSYCAAFDMTYAAGTYVYLEVMPYPASAALPAISSANWVKSAEAPFNCPTGQATTGRTDNTMSRLIPSNASASGFGYITLTAGGFTASVKVNVAAAIEPNPTLTGVYLRVIQNPVAYLKMASGGATINNLAAATIISSTPISGEDLTALTIKSSLSGVNEAAYVQVMPIPTNATLTKPAGNPWSYSGTGLNGQANAGSGGTGFDNFTVVRFRPTEAAGSGTLSVNTNGYTANVSITVQP